LSEDKWFRCGSEIFLKIEFGERFGDKLSFDGSVCGKMLWRYKSITIDSFSLMYPQLDKIIWLLDDFLFGSEKSLEHIGQVTNVEFVMEVLSGLSELQLYFSIKR
jgi:hypothetical protein